MKEKRHRDATRASMQQAVVFDLDETLLDRKGSLDIYAGCLWSSFEANANLDERDFLRTFHDLDGNGRVSRPAFFDGMSRVAFTGVSPAEIATHFNSTAWLRPILFPGALNVVKAFKSNGYAIGVVTNGSSLSQNSKIANSGLSLSRCLRDLRRVRQQEAGSCDLRGNSPPPADTPAGILVRRRRPDLRCCRPGEIRVRNRLDRAPHSMAKGTSRVLQTKNHACFGARRCFAWPPLTNCCNRDPTYSRCAAGLGPQRCTNGAFHGYHNSFRQPLL